MRHEQITAIMAVKFSKYLENTVMDFDLRPLIVLGPIVLVIGWAAFNLGKAVLKGEASLFGKQGNNPFK